jgi:glycosyltransferase 2 family protein
MSQNYTKLLKSVHPTRIIFPLIIGLGVVAFFLFKEYRPGALSILNFSFIAGIFLFIAFLLMAFRDIGYMIRIRILADKKISWLQAFRIIMLWEFTSAVTPSAVGGTSIAVLFVHKEGISVGRSTSIVLATSFLDEIYFILFFPIVLFIVGPHYLFATPQTGIAHALSWTNELFWFASIGYLLKFLYVLLVSYGLFLNPRGIKWLLLKVFKLPFLRRWRNGANETGTEIVTSSLELKNKPFSFWIKAFGATFISWNARYLVVNALFVAFFIVPDHILLFARQMAMWIMMLVSPTPGGSGFAEFIFTRYLGEFIPGTQANLAALAIALAFIWRIISYYPYLLIGSLILPGWLRSKFIQHHEKNSD